MIYTALASCTSSQTTELHQENCEFREMLLSAEWEGQLPVLFNLEKRFETLVIQKISNPSAFGSREFFLALRDTRLTQKKENNHSYALSSSQLLANSPPLTPLFTSIRQLENFVAEHTVDVLHSLFEQGGTSTTASEMPPCKALIVAG